VDVDINYEDSNFIRDLLENELQALDIHFINNQNGLEDVEYSDDEVSFESVDSIVLGHLANIESTTMDNNLLTQIYQSI
jgi:hypothetical protein